MLKRLAVVTVAVFGLLLSAIQAFPVTMHGWPLPGVLGGGMLLSLVIWGAWELIEKKTRRPDPRPIFEGELFNCRQHGFTSGGHYFGDVHSSSGIEATLYLVNRGLRTTVREVVLDGSRLNPPGQFGRAEASLPETFEHGIGHELRLLADVRFEEVDWAEWPDTIDLTPLQVVVVDAFGQPHRIRVKPGESFRPSGR
jgi:hypothetical protein